MVTKQISDASFSRVKADLSDPKLTSPIFHTYISMFPQLELRWLYAVALPGLVGFGGAFMKPVSGPVWRRGSNALFRLSHFLGERVQFCWWLPGPWTLPRLMEAWGSVPLFVPVNPKIFWERGNWAVPQKGLWVRISDQWPFTDH